MSHQPRFDHVSQSQMGFKDAVVHLWPLLLLIYSLPASVPRRILEATAADLLLFAQIPAVPANITAEKRDPTYGSPYGSAK